MPKYYYEKTDKFDINIRIMVADPNSRKILVCEDEKPIAKALELKLTNAGFNASCAFDGEEGLNRIEKESFDLILLDLVMPKKDGFAVLQALKEKNNKIPVIILSNLGQEEDEERARSLGARDFFIKSNTPIASIVEKVKQFF